MKGTAMPCPYGLLYNCRMTKRGLTILILLAFLPAACAPAQPAIQTAIAQTQAAWTPVPSQTPYPTYTLQPTIVVTQIVTQIVTPTFTPTPEFTSTPTVPAPFISVDGVWGHISRDPTKAAFYMLIHNTGEGTDLLSGAFSPACSRMSLQQMGYPDRSNLPISVGIPAKSVVELKMGDFQFRLICYDINGIGVGSSVPLTLNFEKFGPVNVTVEIRELPQG